ncbi:AraC family transcriptional regulator [Microbulbifer spongiae]|uniref:AraC family transcriptional regulator n=1 Tax=Microbulbifer spongiae TaxID=2944933 RepID=A0ABY9EF28_9GAMM|nr:AraC family transcriptional regulator [Microbulbifer sp. MI-G]WKD50643.1 AraC family transcriptional regulator [Microbulbifer sp. MI-G]
MYLDNKDALSKILQGLGLKVDVYAHGDFCGHWAIDTSGSRRMPFHLLTLGKAWLHRPEQEPTLLTAGDLVLFPYDHQHVMSSESKTPPEEQVNQPIDQQQAASANMVCGFFEFSSRIAWPLLDAMPPAVILDFQVQSCQPQIRTIVDLLINELQTREMGCFAAANHLAYLLFIEVLRLQMHRTEQHGLLGALADPKIGKALNLIHNEPEKPWTLDSLAHAVAMGRTAFVNRFRDLVNITPMQYLTQWRMRGAQECLLTSQRSIAAIAEEAGYQSEAAFRKAFKQVTGCSPGQYRKQECK